MPQKRQIAIQSTGACIHRIALDLKFLLKDCDTLDKETRLLHRMCLSLNALNENFKRIEK
jgi:hypothetical protein